MKFIKPSEISSKIMTLLEESDEYVIVVSPYVKISKWYKLIKKFDNLKSRNISIEFIIRDDATNYASFQELNNLGIKFRAIKDLHCKLYMNEKYAIMSSMNLLLSSEINSIELAYQTESDIEFNELKGFCERYLQIGPTQRFTSNDTPSDKDWKESVCQILASKLNGDIQTWQEYGSFNVNTGINNYSAFIWNSKQNRLRISGVLSGKEFNLLQNNKPKIPEIRGLEINLQKGGNGYFDTIWGTGKLSFETSNLNYVFNKEKEMIVRLVSDFIIKIDSFKKMGNAFFI